MSERSTDVDGIRAPFSVRARRKRERHEAIVRSAAALLRRGGASAVSVQSVMSSVSMTPGGFYAHFDDKAALVDEALMCAVTERMAQLSALVATVAPSQRLEVIIEDYLATHHRDHVDDGCSLPSVISEAAIGRSTISTDSLANVVVATRDSLRALEPRLSEGGATALLALMIGAQAIARSLGPTATSDDVLAASLAEALVISGADRTAGPAPTAPARPLSDLPTPRPTT